MTSFTGFVWQPEHALSDSDPADAAHVQQICAEMRWTDDQIQHPGWFHPTLKSLHNPHAMDGMDAAVQRLRTAFEQQEHIRIITDYDVDGTTSSLILQATLRLLQPGLTVDYHIPDRFNEGYGFSAHAAQRAVDDGVGLIVTADIGIRDQQAVDVAKAGGVDVLICDHHLPSGADVPTGAIVLCPPQRACEYPNPHLAACGVSLKLAQALLSSHPKFDRIFESMLKLAAIGTVADMVSLSTAENRAIVTLGLQALNRTKHAPGLQALLDVSKIEVGKIDEGTIGFQIGPRINAAGRLADAKIIVELLTCRDPQRARALAQQVDEMNRARKAIQERLAKQALEQIVEPSPPFILVAGQEQDGWHRGVVGIVASRLMRSTHRPAAVVSIQGELAVGSMRSLPGFNCVALLDTAADLLKRYGGHAKAAGFTVETQHLKAFEQRLCEAVTQMATSKALTPTHQYTLKVDPKLLDFTLTEHLNQLSPFGIGNPRPLFLITDLPITNAKTMSNGKHLKLTLASPLGALEAVWWNQGQLAEQLDGQRVDVLASISINEWGGRRRLQLLLTDARTHQPYSTQSSSGP